MLEIDQAIEAVLASAQPLSAVELELREALFHRLAKPVVSDVDFPPFDRSVMDGYAVRAADVVTTPARLRMVGCVAAGEEPGRSVGPGEAMQINTGAPIPAGADAVVRVERTVLAEAGRIVEVQEPVSPGTFLARRRAYGKAGEVVLDVGTLLTPINVAAAATAGAARVSVVRRPTVAIISTGSELVDVSVRPTGAQIRNSNEPLLAALLAEQYFSSTSLGSALDDPQRIRAAVESASEFDALCITGGISMGAFDFVPRVLKECGATFMVHKVAIKPGRPTIVARMPDEGLVFALPGNPLSAFVGFHLLVKPALNRMAGGGSGPQVPIQVRLSGTLQPTRDRQSYIPARVQANNTGDYVAQLLRWHGSGDPLGAAGANALVVRRPHAPAAQDGDLVSVLIVGSV